jgi:hypothetical protein
MMAPMRYPRDHGAIGVVRATTTSTSENTVGPDAMPETRGDRTVE